jgi:membrane-bound metal-dependent hydrolase YbcI (DUF457 family)
MLVVSGVAADSDYVSYFGGPAIFIRFHRTLLHSLLGSAIVACVVTAAFLAIDKIRSQNRDVGNPSPGQQGFSPGPVLLVCVIGVASHLMLDLVSGIGVQLFWPFRAGWQGWELLNNMDPWVLTLLAAAFLLPELFRMVSEEIGERKKTARGRGLAIGALVLLIFYVGARADLHGKAINLLGSREYHGRPPLSVSAFPLSSTPFSWRGLISTDATVEELLVSLFPGEDFDPDHSFTRYKPEASAVVDSGQRTQAAKTFLAYAKIAFASVTHVEDGYQFQLRDLRFPSGDTSPDNIIVRVDFSSNLQIRLEELRYARSKAP